jgi:endonuclease-8
VTSVTARGKHLLIDLDDGLTLHSHLGMTGSWHRYARGEPWRRPASGLVALLETDRHVVVCFDAPVLELLEHRALELHPALAGLGPDLLGDEPDLDAAVARLLDARRARLSIGEALLDQTAVAGLGNVYRSELLFIERLDPLVPTGSMPAERLVRLLEGGRDLLRANTGGGDRVTMPDALGARPEAPAGLRRRADRWVYGRAGRPCRRCGTLIRSQALGRPPRRVFWCPRCQGGEGSASDGHSRHPMPAR